MDLDNQAMAHARELREEYEGFLLDYRFGMLEIETKISILRKKFAHKHAYNPIEHVTRRLKSLDSLAVKVERKGIATDVEAIRAHVTDIAGIRISGTFVSDAYRLFDRLTRHDDILVRSVKDYIAPPFTAEDPLVRMHCLGLLGDFPLHEHPMIEREHRPMYFLGSVSAHVIASADGDVHADSGSAVCAVAVSRSCLTRGSWIVRLGGQP